MKKRFIIALAAMFLMTTCLLFPGTPAHAAEVTTVPLEDKNVFSANGVTITAKDLLYDETGMAELNMELSYTGRGTMFVYITEMYINNWLVPYSGTGIFRVTPMRPCRRSNWSSIPTPPTFWRA